MKYLSCLLGALATLCVFGKQQVTSATNNFDTRVHLAVFSGDIELSSEDLSLVRRSLDYHIDRIRIVKINDDAFQSIKSAPKQLLELCRNTKGLCEKFSFSENIDPKSPAGINGGTTIKLNAGEFVSADLTLNLFSDVRFDGLSYFRLSVSEQVGSNSKSLGGVIQESINGYASSIRFDNDKIKSIKIKQDRRYFVKPIDGLVNTKLYGEGLYAVIEEAILPMGPNEMFSYADDKLNVSHEKVEVKVVDESKMKTF